MESLRNLLGDEWIKQEVLSADPEHLLGRWHKKNPDNPFTRYADDLAGFILKGGVKCDLARLATKLKSEFVETLVEMGYAVFLAKQGFQVTMEPTAPEAGPDFSTTLTSGLVRLSFLAYSKIPLRFSGMPGRRSAYLASMRAPSVGPKVSVNQAVCSGRVMLEK